jgi:hypothetical protein
MHSSGRRTKYTVLEKAFNESFKRSKIRIPSSVIAQDNLQLSSEAEGTKYFLSGMHLLTLSGIVFAIIEETRHEERTYDDHWMNCSSMGECEFRLIPLVALTIEMSSRPRCLVSS